MKYKIFQILIFLALFYGCKKENNFPKIIAEKNSEKLVIMSDSEKIKFVTKYKFDDFPVIKIDSKKMKVQLNTNINSFTKSYKTMINESYESEEINFAGKYILNYWGCGSPCAVGIAINTRNGKLIEIPASSVGYQFQKNSRLLIVNPPDSLDYYIKDCVYCKPELYLLDTLKYEFVKLEE